jgi:NADH:ubiquinone oxidoreductase subunit D
MVDRLLISFEEVKNSLLVVPDAIEKIRDETHDEEDQAQYSEGSSDKTSPDLTREITELEIVVHQ